MLRYLTQKSLAHDRRPRVPYPAGVQLGQNLYCVPKCGTSKARSFFTKLSSISGSRSYASSPTTPMWPSSKAFHIAASSVMAPRAVFTITIPGFIFAISLAPIRCWAEGMVGRGSGWYRCRPTAIQVKNMNIPLPSPLEVGYGYNMRA